MLVSVDVVGVEVGVDEEMAELLRIALDDEDEVIFTLMKLLVIGTPVLVTEVLAAMLSMLEINEVVVTLGTTLEGVTTATAEVVITAGVVTIADVVV